jgi:murein DD-endopeptidase MepM/ murein hydrolase activator NlpD
VISVSYPMNILTSFIKRYFLFFCLGFSLFSQEGGVNYPRIYHTSSFSDTLFKQHQEALNNSQLILALLNSSIPVQEDYQELKNRLLSQLLFFTYAPNESDTIYTVAADFMINADTLASLNNLERSAYFTKKDVLIIPSIPGLYICEDEGNELTLRLRENHRDSRLSFPVIINEGGVKKSYRFYPNDTFTGNERLYFVSLPFRSPLDHNWDITSPFGNRNHPVLNNWEFHNGIDVRAPLGTPVYAIEDGIILMTTELDNYGIIIILNHEGGYESRYAHLNRVFVKKGDKVNRGQIIAETGNTGISTGPHLHFEIRLGNRPINPVKLVTQGSR